MRTPDWQTADGSVQLHLGDCLEILPTLGKVDAVVTDPPYGVDLGETTGSGGSHGLHFTGGYESHDDSYESFVANVVPRINAALDATARGLVWTGPHIHEQRKPSVIGGVYVSAGAGRHCWGFKTFLPVLLYGAHPSLQKGASVPTTISSNARADKSDHPCPKPLEWMEWSVRLASNKGEAILDPFMGSGTTGVACVRTGRKFIGIEKEPKYFEIAIKRIEAELNRTALFEPAPKILRQASLLETA